MFVGIDNANNQNGNAPQSKIGIYKHGFSSVSRFDNRFIATNVVKIFQNCKI